MTDWNAEKSVEIYDQWTKGKKASVLRMCDHGIVLCHPCARCTARSRIQTERKILVRGVGRIADEPRAVLVMLNEIPTDDELRDIHEVLQEFLNHA